jgi:hypothetical protein
MAERAPSFPEVTPDVTISVRGTQYGPYSGQSQISQSLKRIMRATPNWDTLTAAQRESLEMIQHKIARILNGNPNYVDSWHDISGYALLVEKQLLGEDP